MPLKPSNVISLCAICLSGSLLSSSAQSFGPAFSGKMPVLPLEVLENRALYKNEGVFPNVSPLSITMGDKGIQMTGDEPGKIEMYKRAPKVPDSVYFPLLIEPTPTAPGIPTIDQTKSLQLLNNSFITLAPKPSPKKLELSTPTLSNPTEYTTRTISKSATLLNQGTTETLYARTSIQISPSVTPTASEVVYMDLDIESPDTTRFYQKEEGGNPVPGFLEKIILTSSGDQKQNQEQKEEGTSQNQQKVDSSTHSTHTGYTGSGSITPTASSAALSAAATPGLPGAEAAASPEQPDEPEEGSLLAQFKSYHSIENTSLEKLINKVRDKLEQNPEQQHLWVVLEKLHGCNLSFWSNGKEVKAARRNDWIKDGEKFFNYKPVLEKYREMILAMYRQFCKEGDTLTVTGELYGGNIQGQVFYQKDIDFAAFDIFVNRQKIDHDTFQAWTSATGIPTAREINTYGSFEEALNVDPVFPSLHSERGDLAEGVVIKPVKPLFYGNGQTIIFKKKNPEFAETNSKKSRPASKKSTPAEDKVLLEKNKPVLNALLAKITKNRLDSVISKMGELTLGNHKKVKGALIQDAMTDYSKENEQAAKEQVNDPQQWKLIQQEVGLAAHVVVQTELKSE